MLRLLGVFQRPRIALWQGLVVAALLPWVGCAAIARQPAMPYGPQDAATFLGTWCAQGDPSKQASIASSFPGPFLNLTNESGSTSYGRLQGPNQIVAPQWDFVVGTLSPDGSQINWSNGTMWARCPSDSGGWPGYPGFLPRLTGTWYANGDPARRCSIRQRQGALDLRNEAGQSASGVFLRRHLVTTNWNGNTIQGRISRDGDRIDWNNGTYWVRAIVYSH